MSLATSSNRLRIPQFLACGAISSPGIALTEVLPEPTGTRAIWGREIPVWQQNILARRREQNIVLGFAAILTTHTGTVRPVAIFPTISFEKSTRVRSLHTTASVPGQVAQVRASFSLQIKQLAEVLNVERPTVYAWIKEQSEPRPQKRSRLRQLYQLAKCWDSLAIEPLGKALTEVASDGCSILELLQQSEIPQSLIAERLRGIANTRARGEAGASPRKKSPAQIAEERGIEMARVREQSGKIDILTGKRIASD